MIGNAHTSNTTALQVDDVHISYGAVTAVNGVSFSVPAGQVVGLLGGNGAGKSSTLKCAAGVLPPHSGTVSVAGWDVTDGHDAETARQLVGYCPDVGGLIRMATPREHIGLALALRGHLHQWPAALDLLDQFNLSSALDRVTAGFSHGMSRRLSVMLAVLTADKLLILDEPFDGVDPAGIDITIDMIHLAAQSGVGVVVSTHLLELLVQASDHIVVMHEGRIVDSGAADQFTAAGDGTHRYRTMLTRS